MGVTEGAARCPTCKGVMRGRTAREVSLDLCPTCRGVWFDRGELERFVRDRGPQPAPRGARPGDRPQSTRGSPPGSRPAARPKAPATGGGPCPRCRAPLRVETHHGMSGLVCAAHGIFVGPEVLTAAGLREVVGAAGAGVLVGSGLADTRALLEPGVPYDAGPLFDSGETLFISFEVITELLEFLWDFF